jgi:hypothetical protein
MPPRAVVGFVVVLCCGVVCAGVKKTCLHYALLPGWDAAVERGAMHKTSSTVHSAAQARAWADGDFDADHGFGLDGVGRSAH